MDAFWLTIYLSLACGVIIQSLLLALQTWEHCRYVRSCMRNRHAHRPTGHVALFAPCKGVDLDLETNLRALFHQDYDDYEITFIVECIDDPAYPVIRRAIAENPGVPARVMVAGRATDSGQKVHNLRVATEHLAPRVKYLAFVDSDACPRPEWLRSLVARLDEPGLGAVTGYRWFTPEKASIANSLVYSMNCDVVSLLTRSSHRLIWGGSWAIRRDVFDAIELHDAWRGTLSDDLVAARLMRRHRLDVRFEPACIVASPLDQSLWNAMAFIRRQYLVTRLYTRDWWLFSLLAATCTNAIGLGNLGVFVWSLYTGALSPWIPLGVSLVLYLVTVYRGTMRQSLVKTYFPRWEKTSGRTRLLDIFANPFVEFAHWLGIVLSSVGSHVYWRGICYRVLRGGQVKEIIRTDDSSAAAEADATFYRKAG